MMRPRVLPSLYQAYTTAIFPQPVPPHPTLIARLIYSTCTLQLFLGLNVFQVHPFNQIVRESPVSPHSLPILFPRHTMHITRKPVPISLPLNTQIRSLHLNVHLSIPHIIQSIVYTVGGKKIISTKFASGGRKYYSKHCGRAL